MAFLEKYDFDLLKNEAETLVIQEIERQVKSGHEGMCLCNECVVDIAAISLNSIRPLYRFSLLGSLYASQAMSEEDYAKSIKDAVNVAIRKVKRNPSHD